MFTKRTTTIKFVDEIEFANAMLEFGINVRKFVSNKSYYDGNDYIYDDTAKHLMKHGIPVRIVLDWGTKCKTDWNTSCKIKECFGFTGSLDIYGRIISAVTYNLDVEAHKEMVKKIYDPIKAKGYTVTHECETEVSGDECV